MGPQPIILDPRLTTLDDPTPYIEKGIVCIPLQHGHVAFVDEADYHLVAGFHWIARRGCRCHGWYAVANVWKGRGRSPTMLQMHALIKPGFPLLDHKDRNGLNNRRNNLRPADGTFNNYNSAKRVGRSSYRGVRDLSP